MTFPTTVLATQEVSHLFASWHPALVHLPLGALLLVLPLEIISLATRRRSLSDFAQILLVAGTVGLMFTFITGIYAEVCAARAQIPQVPIGKHESLATAASWLFLGITALRGWASQDKTKPFRVYLVLLLIATGFLVATGWQGGQLVYQFAAGVHGVKPPIPPTPQDLANLTLQNTEDELAYSDMMHHIFGWVTLGLALWLSYLSTNLPHKDKIRSVGPVLLTAGGLFLMLFSDWDSWPWSDRLPITDPEVLFHKVLATVMIAFGIGMNLARFRDGGVASQLQAKVLAILALLGGGMLFTHVHTGAPYSDTAEGIYIQHFAVGCLALLCGANKILEAYLASQDSRETQQSPRKKGIGGFDLAWIVLLYVISANLLWYREGYPWYFQSVEHTVRSFTGA